MWMAVACSYLYAMPCCHPAAAPGIQLWCICRSVMQVLLMLSAASGWKLVHAVCAVIGASGDCTAVNR